MRNQQRHSIYTVELHSLGTDAYHTALALLPIRRADARHKYTLRCPGESCDRAVALSDWPRCVQHVLLTNESTASNYSLTYSRYSIAPHLSKLRLRHATAPCPLLLRFLSNRSQSCTPSPQSSSQGRDSVALISLILVSNSVQSCTITPESLTQTLYIVGSHRRQRSATFVRGKKSEKEKRESGS